MAVAHAQLMSGGTLRPRRRRLAAAALRLVQGAAPFLQALGGAGGGSGAGSAGREERLNERVAQLQRALDETR